MAITESSAAKPGQDHEHDRDRELVRAITDALCWPPRAWPATAR